MFKPPDTELPAAYAEESPGGGTAAPGGRHKTRCVEEISHYVGLLTEHTAYLLECSWGRGMYRYARWRNISCILSMVPSCECGVQTLGLSSRGTRSPKSLSPKSLTVQGVRRTFRVVIREQLLQITAAKERQESLSRLMSIRHEALNTQ